MKRIQQDSQYVEKMNLNKAKLYRQSYFWVFGAEENGLVAGRLLDCSQSPAYFVCKTVEIEHFALVEGGRRDL